MNKFTKPATVFFFADQDGRFHNYKQSDNPRHDAFLTLADLDRIDKITFYSDYITIEVMGVVSKLRRADVIFNEDGTQFFYSEVVFDVFGDNNFTMSMSDDQLGLRDLHLMVQDLIVWNKFGINLFGRR